MTKYSTQVNYDFKKDGTYQIVLVEEVTTQTNKHYLRVTCAAKDKDDQRNYVEALWLNDEVRASSAFGSFVSAFGDDTDDWIGKWFQVIAWEIRRHEIYPVVTSKPKLAKEAEKILKGGK